MNARARVRGLVDSMAFQRTIVAVILLNAVSLGLETSADLTDRYATAFETVERVIVSAFVLELGLRIYAYGLAFFRDPWNWFDLIIIAIATVPASEEFSILRLTRVLRLLLLISAVPSMRRIVTALSNALAGLLSIFGLLLLAVYSGAVFGQRLFHDDAPELFGTLGRSLFTMFKVATVENWEDIADQVLPGHPFGWIFFVVYLVIVAFVLVNLLIGVIVNAVDVEMSGSRRQEDQDLERVQHELVMAELRAMREELAELRARRAEADNGDRRDPSGAAT